MKDEFHKYKSITKGLVTPNILSPAAYLLFSAEVCTGSLKHKPSGHIANVPPLSLASKPVDQLDTIEALAQLEDNTDWLALYHTNRFELPVNVSTPSSKLPPVPVASGAIEAAKVSVAPSVGEGIVEPTERAAEEVAAEEVAAKVPTEVVAEGVVLTLSPETRQKSDHVNHSNATISNKMPFNRIEPNKKSLIPLGALVTKCFETNITMSNPIESTGSSLLDPPIENDAIKDPHQQKVIHEMGGMVSNCENYLTEN